MQSATLTMAPLEFQKDASEDVLDGELEVEAEVEVAVEDSVEDGVGVEGDAPPGVFPVSLTEDDAVGLRVV